METQSEEDLIERKLKTLLSLAESSWTEYDTRRAYEWKINFGLWMSIGIIGGFSIKESYTLNNWIWIIIAGIAASYIFWQYGLHNSHRHDQEKRHLYEEEIRKIINLNLPEKLVKRPSTSDRWFVLNWSHFTQILITIAFLLLLGIILTTKTNNINMNDLNNSFNKHYVEKQHRHFN